MSIAMVADVKTHLSITGTDKDAVLTAIVAGAEANVVRLAKDAGILLVTEEVSEQLDGADSERLILSYRPVVAVSGVWVSEARSFTDAAKIAETAYVVYARTGILRRVDGDDFPEGVQNVKVTYHAGYGEAAPADLTEGIVLLAAAIYGQVGKEGLSGERIGDYSYTVASLQERVPAAYALLAPYIDRLVVA